LSRQSAVDNLVDSVLGELMTVGFGGLLHPAGREISKEKLGLLERIEHVTFELAWDACRYLRDPEIVEVTARRYWSLIRFATLNGLQKLQAEFLKNARNCAEICNEERDGKPLSEGRRYLEERITMTAKTQIRTLIKESARAALNLDRDYSKRQNAF
jgi:hypothetical protein